MTLPEADGVRVLWHHEWYDGPVNGLAEWRGERWWFDLPDDETASYLVSPRRYVLRPLSAAEADAEQAEHDAWAARWDADGPAAVSEEEWREEPYRDRPGVAAFSGGS